MEVDINQPLEKTEAVDIVQIVSSDEGQGDEDLLVQTLASETGYTHTPYSSREIQEPVEEQKEPPPKKEYKALTITLYVLCATAQILAFVIGLIIGYLLL